MGKIDIAQVLSRLDSSSLNKLYPYEAFSLILRISKPRTSDIILDELLTSLSIPELLSNTNSQDIIISVLQPNEIKILQKAYNLPDLGKHPENIRALKSRLKIKSKEPRGLDPFYISFGADPRDLLLNEDTAIDYQTKEYTKFESEANASYQLHPYQSDLLNRVTQCFEGGNGQLPATRALLHMPTGSGKTRTAMVLACRYLMNNPKGLVIWLADTFELCDQAAKEFLVAWGHLGDRTIPLFRIYGKSKDKRNYNSIQEGFVVATLQSATAARRKEAELNLQTLSALSLFKPLVIVDEAHKAPAPQYKKVIESLVPVTLGNKVARLLGLTATPGRATSDREADQNLVQMFGGKIFSLEIKGYPTAIDFLTSEGYLAKAIFRPISSNIDLSSLKLTNSEKKGTISRTRLNQILQFIGEDVERNFLIFEELKKLASRHSRIIFFAASVEQSKRMAYVLRLRKYEAKSVSADETSPKERVKTIEWFKTPKAKSPEPRIICNYGILTTGFDAPETSAVLIGRPTQSLVLFSQMVGRGLRGIRSGGNKEAEIVSIVDQEIPGFSNVSAAFTHWNSSWMQTSTK